MWEVVDYLLKQKLLVFVKKCRGGRMKEWKLHVELRRPLLQRHVPITQETGNKSESVDKVGKAEADYKCLSSVMHIHRQIWKHVCVLLCACSVSNPAWWRHRIQAENWAYHPSGLTAFDLCQYLICLAICLVWCKLVIRISGGVSRWPISCSSSFVQCCATFYLPPKGLGYMA